MARKPKVYKDDIVFDNEFRKASHRLTVLTHGADRETFDLDSHIERNEFNRFVIVYYRSKALEIKMMEHEHDISNMKGIIDRLQSEVQRLTCIVGMLRMTSTVPNAENVGRESEDG